MSVEFAVFLRNQDIPTRADWQRAIDGAGVGLVLDDFDIRTHSGYLPVTLKGQRTGFECYLDDAAESDWVSEQVRGGRDKAISFRLGGDDQEMRAAILAAAVLTSRFNGLFVDEDGETATGDGVFESIAQGEAAQREAHVARAAADAAITDRRCPKCGSPCPTYRKTCEACGYAIGRG